MIPSLAGLLVCCIVALLARAMGSVTLVGLPAALAFGATAFATLPALGGSSPQIYTLFAIGLVLGPFLRRDGLRALIAGAGQQPVTLALAAMIIHVSATALILPRLFAGKTSVFVPGRPTGEIIETYLEPVSGNISQAAYFVLGALTCIALLASLTNTDRLRLIARGLMLWALLNAGLGAVDILAKIGNLGDVLEIIRTASYAMVTDVEHAGFFRIAGGQSEASAFGGAIFASTVFCMTWARMTGDRRISILAAGSLALLLLSTSTTAYACLAVYCLGLLALAVFNLLKGRVRKADLALVYLALGGVTLAIIIFLRNETAFEAITRLLNATVFEKASSSSAAERGYWNTKSLEAFMQTGGLGIGIGSSRASNWLIAVLSQTGAIGAALQIFLALTLLRPLPGPTSDLPAHAPEVRALYEASRATGLASLTAAMLAGGSADPGMLFFICIAVTLSCRRLLRVDASRARDMRLKQPAGAHPGQRKYLAG